VASDTPTHPVEGVTDDRRNGQSPPRRRAPSVARRASRGRWCARRATRSASCAPPTAAPPTSRRLVRPTSSLQMTAAVGHSLG